MEACPLFPIVDHYIFITTVNFALGMYDTWLFKGNGFTPNNIKEAVKLRTELFIQEW